jgi:hypothetical protein
MEMSESIVARWSRGEVPINRLPAIHCPECGYRSHGELDMGAPVICEECLPVRKSCRVIEHIGEPDNDE